MLAVATESNQIQTAPVIVSLEKHQLHCEGDNLSSADSLSLAEVLAKAFLQKLSQFLPDDQTS
jgi:hypothetical protein